jgi:predicted amino acid-binding ACT domain protein
MANEDLIYRITRAVYERLGPSADEQMVEQLVTDIYHEVGLDNRPETGAVPSSSSARMIISVFGLDHPGIVAGVSQILAEASCSIIDINQTVVQGKFAMVIIADTARARESTAELRNASGARENSWACASTRSAKTFSTRCIECENSRTVYV